MTKPRFRLINEADKCKLNQSFVLGYTAQLVERCGDDLEIAGSSPLYARHFFSSNKVRL